MEPNGFRPCCGFEAFPPGEMVSKELRGSIRFGVVNMDLADGIEMFWVNHHLGSLVSR
jgi:hypothetical protein